MTLLDDWLTSIELQAWVSIALANVDLAAVFADELTSCGAHPTCRLGQVVGTLRLWDGLRLGAPPNLVSNAINMGSQTRRSVDDNRQETDVRIEVVNSGPTIARSALSRSRSLGRGHATGQPHHRRPRVGLYIVPSCPGAGAMLKCVPTCRNRTLCACLAVRSHRLSSTRVAQENAWTKRRPELLQIITPSCQFSARGRKACNTY
jgi:hypothetical protein